MSLNTELFTQLIYFRVMPIIEVHKSIGTISWIKSTVLRKPRIGMDYLFPITNPPDHINILSGGEITFFVPLFLFLLFASGLLSSSEYEDGVFLEVGLAVEDQKSSSSEVVSSTSLFISSSSWCSSSLKQQWDWVTQVYT